MMLELRFPPFFFFAVFSGNLVAETKMIVRYVLYCRRCPPRSAQVTCGFYAFHAVLSGICKLQFKYKYNEKYIANAQDKRAYNGFLTGSAIMLQHTDYIFGFISALFFRLYSSSRWEVALPFKSLSPA